MPSERDPATAFGDPAVARVFAAWPPATRQALVRLRSLIFETAAATPGVGRIEETLKWGQPAYLTPETGSGTTVRIDRVKGEPARVALYVHCRTDLVGRYRALYADTLAFGGNRAIVLDIAAPFPAEALRHCIALALTYHRRRQGTS